MSTLICNYMQKYKAFVVDIQCVYTMSHCISVCMHVWTLIAMVRLFRLNSNSERQLVFVFSLVCTRATAAFVLSLGVLLSWFRLERRVSVGRLLFFSLPLCLSVRRIVLELELLCSSLFFI